MNVNEIIEQYISHPMHKNLNMNVHFGKESATVSMTIHESILNLVGTLHGAIYFKLIDDSCFFAALSAKESHFVATKGVIAKTIKNRATSLFQDQLGITPQVFLIPDTVKAALMGGFALAHSSTVFSQINS